MSTFEFRVNNEKYEVASHSILGGEILKTAGLEPPEDFELLIKVNEKGFEPVQLDELIDLREPGIEGFQAKPYRKILINVDDQSLEIEELFSTPREILSLTDKDSEEYYLVQTTGDREITYENDQDHRMTIRNGQTFITYRKKWKFKIETETHIWSKQFISGVEVRAIPPGIPSNMDLFLKVKGKPGRLIQGDEKVDLGKPGIEKFYAQVADSTPGTDGITI